ncbi:MAG: hypothetical protein WBP29_00145 [Candidatus Zixiibacteriota bacterium]
MNTRTNSRFSFRVIILILPVALAGFGLSSSLFAQEDTTITATEQMSNEATAMMPLVKSDFAKQFLLAMTDLPKLDGTRIIYRNRQTREAMTEDEFKASGLDTTTGFTLRGYGEDFYYFTGYGTPVAVVRAYDLIGQAGMKSADGAKIIDFGFGSIGQLRGLASLGADVTGIEVEAVFKALYSAPTDTGKIPRGKTGGTGPDGYLRAFYGFFPTDSLINKQLGSGYDLFFSKNTLKNGYIHPEREVDPKMLVHLGVDDSTFVKRVYDLLKPGGFFMIYNLHPKYTGPEVDKYIPWSDGRSPFKKDLFEKIGLEVLAFDVVDTPFAHTMARTFGWDKDMDLENDLFGMYTLVRKK